MKRAYHAIRSDDPKVAFKWLMVVCRFLNVGGHSFHVVRVQELHEGLKRGPQRIGLKTMDSVKLFGPHLAVVGGIPFPAADVGDLLSLCQSRFAGSQRALDFVATSDDPRK